MFFDKILDVFNHCIRNYFAFVCFYFVFNGFLFAFSDAIEYDFIEPGSGFLRHHDEAVEQARPLGDARLMSRLLNNLAEARRSAGHRPSAGGEGPRGGALWHRRRSDHRPGPP